MTDSIVIPALLVASALSGGVQHSHAMEGFYGSYDAGREGSGTSWLPASTPMESYHFQATLAAPGILHSVSRRRQAYQRPKR